MARETTQLKGQSEHRIYFILLLVEPDIMIITITIFERGSLNLDEKHH